MRHLKTPLSSSQEHELWRWKAHVALFIVWMNWQDFPSLLLHPCHLATFLFMILMFRPHINGIMQYLSMNDWLISLNTTPSWFSSYAGVAHCLFLRLNSNLISSSVQVSVHESNTFQKFWSTMIDIAWVLKVLSSYNQEETQKQKWFFLIPQPVKTWIMVGSTTNLYKLMGQSHSSQSRHFCNSSSIESQGRTLPLVTCPPSHDVSFVLN